MTFQYDYRLYFMTFQYNYAVFFMTFQCNPGRKFMTFQKPVVLVKSGGARFGYLSFTLRFLDRFLCFVSDLIPKYRK